MRAFRLGGRRPVWLLAAVLVLVGAGVAIAVVATRSSGSSEGERLALWGARNAEAQKEAEGGEEAEAEREREGKGESEAGQRRGGESFAREAAAIVRGEEGGEADRTGPLTPWGEQVANRAYPRGY